MSSFKQCRVVLTVFLIISFLLLSACIKLELPTNEKSEATGEPPDTAVSTPEPVSEPASGPQTKQLPQIDSSTARIPITDAIYSLFTDTYGYAGPKPLASKTHGAWLNLADGKADIIFLVAPTEDELAYFAEKHVDIEMKIYGYDGLVFIGNESNPVQNLTTRQIRDIYSGKVKNWNAVGGENADMIVYIRNAESGSQRLFESLVWDGYEMPDFSRLNFREDEINPTVTQRKTQIKVEQDMDTITKSVLLNQYSIGFNIMSYIDSEFAGSTLKLFSVNGYAPTTENFASGKYPYLTTSYVAIRADEPEGSPARQLYDWVSSQESYDLIAQNSTLTVSFSDSVIIKAGAGLPAKQSAPAQKMDLIEMILRLDKEYISWLDLAPYTPDEIGYIRNGVYALSGKIFKTKKYADFFGAQSWYHGTSPTDSVIAKKFNDFQKKNLELLLAYESAL